LLTGDSFTGFGCPWLNMTRIKCPPAKPTAASTINPMMRFNIARFVSPKIFKHIHSIIDFAKARPAAGGG